MSNEEIVAETSALLSAFYAEYNPANLQRIDEILDSYKGIELELITNLMDKYSISMQDIQDLVPGNRLESILEIQKQQKATLRLKEKEKEKSKGKGKGKKKKMYKKGDSNAAASEVSEMKLDAKKSPLNLATYAPSPIPILAKEVSAIEEVAANLTAWTTGWTTSTPATPATSEHHDSSSDATDNDSCAADIDKDKDKSSKDVGEAVSSIYDSLNVESLVNSLSITMSMSGSDVVSPAPAPDVADPVASPASPASPIEPLEPLEPLEKERNKELISDDDDVSTASSKIEINSGAEEQFEINSNIEGGVEYDDHPINSYTTELNISSSSSSSPSKVTHLHKSATTIIHHLESEHAKLVKENRKLVKKIQAFHETSIDELSSNSTEAEEETLLLHSPGKQKQNRYSVDAPVIVPQISVSGAHLPSEDSDSTNTSSELSQKNVKIKFLSGKLSEKEQHIQVLVEQRDAALRGMESVSEQLSESESSKEDMKAEMMETSKNRDSKQKQLLDTIQLNHRLGGQIRFLSSRAYQSSSQTFEFLSEDKKAKINEKMDSHHLDRSGFSEVQNLRNTILEIAKKNSVSEPLSLPSNTQQLQNDDHITGGGSKEEKGSPKKNPILFNTIGEQTTVLKDAIQVLETSYTASRLEIRLAIREAAMAESRVNELVHEIKESKIHAATELELSQKLEVTTAELEASKSLLQNTIVKVKHLKNDLEISRSTTDRLRDNLAIYETAKADLVNFSRYHVLEAESRALESARLAKERVLFEREDFIAHQQEEQALRNELRLAQRKEHVLETRRLRNELVKMSQNDLKQKNEIAFLQSQLVDAADTIIDFQNRKK